MTDQRIQYTEEMVGAGHGTKADTLNRLALVEHNTDGTHGAITTSAPATPTAKTLYEDTIIKAWCDWSYSGGVPSIDDDVNVTSITDNSTGNLTLNLATAFSSLNYGASAITEGTDFGLARVTAKMAASVTIELYDTVGADALDDINGTAIFVGKN